MKHNITFTTTELQIIDSLLQGAPFKVAAPLIHSINKQLSAQHDAAADLRDMPSGHVPAPDYNRGD